MNSPKNILIALLTLTTVGGAILAWRQYGDLVELRAAAMNRDERTDFQQRIADLERLNRELQDQLAVLRGTDDLEGMLAAAGDERSAEDRGKRGDRSRGTDARSRGNDGGRQQAAAIRELMAKPEVQAMISLQQKAAIEARYAALFKNLNLNAEQTEKLKTLLAERGNTRRDVEEAARAQGINPRDNPDAYRKLFTDAQNELNAGIKSTIGEQGFAQLQTFEQTMPQRNLVENLQQRLSHTNLPLTSAQAEQLVQILAANAPQRTATGTAVNSTSPAQPGQFGSGRGPGMGFAFGGPGGGSTDFGRGGPELGRIFGGGGATVTAAAVAQAQTILAPPQVAALQAIQQQQQAQQQVQQLVRDTLAANAPQAKKGQANGTGAGTNTGTTSGTTPTRKRGGGE